MEMGNTCVRRSLARPQRLIFNVKSSFETITQERVEIGDIILLKKDEICTADILVLVCREQQCLVETSQIDGTSDFKLVQPVASTNEEKISIPSILKSYKYTLSGKIEYYPLIRESKNFDGYIKLESDPKGEKLAFHNLIQRGSFLKNTDW